MNLGYACQTAIRMVSDLPSKSESLEPAGDFPWNDLVQWAETDLRRQIERSLPAGSPISVSTVIHSTLRRAVVRRGDLHFGFRHATSFVAGMARKVRREKFRREDAMRRRPADGNVLPLGSQEDTLHARPLPDQAIWDNVSKLPEDLNFILLAVYKDRRTLKEIAALQGISEKQAERLHRRALQNLRRLLDQES